MYTHSSSPETLSPYISNSRRKTLLTFQFPDTLQHNSPYPYQFPRIASTLQRIKTTPCLKKLQSHHLVQLKGVIEQ